MRAKLNLTLHLNSSQTGKCVICCKALGNGLQFPPPQRRSALRKHFRLTEVGLRVCRLYYVGTPDSHISPEHQLCKTFLQPTYNICASEHNPASALVTVEIAGDEPLKMSAWSARSPTPSHLHPSFTRGNETSKQTNLTIDDLIVPFIALLGLSLCPARYSGTVGDSCRSSEAI